MKRAINTYEELDNLSLDEIKVGQAMRGLKVINHLLGNKGAVLNELKTINGIPTVVDIGCGGGDLLSAIRQEIPKAKLIGVDGNPNVVSFAKRNSENDISFVVGNILDKNFKIPECDLLISSHFLYRFKDEELVVFLKKSSERVKNKIVISELQRAWLPLVLFSILTTIIPVPRIVKNDGLVAIKKSFTRNELKNILDEIRLPYTIQWKWAFRYIITIDTYDGNNS